MFNCGLLQLSENKPKETCTVYGLGNKENLRDIEFVYFLSTNICPFSDIAVVISFSECITYFSSDICKIASTK